MVNASPGHFWGPRARPDPNHEHVEVVAKGAPWRAANPSRMRRVVALLAMLVFAGAAAGAAAAKTVRVTQNSHQPVLLAQGDRLLVVLRSNASTGFQWKVVGAASPILVRRGSSYKPGGSRPGAAGTQTFAFRAGKAGETQLVLIYQQSGSNHVGVRFRLTVRVRS